MNRNKVVFDFVFHYYYSGLCAFSEKITGSAQAAEDIVQDMFVSLWVRHRRITITTSLKNYLFTAVKNRSLDYLKHENKKSQKLAGLSKGSAPAENFSIYWFAESELQSLVESSLEKLPPRTREIFEMSRFKGLKNQEIADSLGLSKRSVELQVSNALRQLRQDLKPYMPFLFFFLSPL